MKSKINIRVGIICPYYFPNEVGGSEISTKLLAESLVKENIKVTVFSFDGNKVESINGVRIIRTPLKISKQLFVSMTLSVFNVMKKYKSEIDLFHIYNVFPLPGAGLFKMFYPNKKVIATLNNYEAISPLSKINSKTWLKRFLNLRKETKNVLELFFAFGISLVYPFFSHLSRKLDYYIAIGTRLKEIYIVNKFDEKRITVITNFFDESLRKKKTRKIRKINSLLYVGRLSKEKGVDILIRAFLELLKDDVNLELKIVGDGSEIDKLKRVYKNKRIIFYGQVKSDKIKSFFKTNSLFVHPSVWEEPFSRTVLESMSFQVPIIVSDLGESPRIIGNKKFIFKQGDVLDLKNKIKFLIENPYLVNSQVRDNIKILKKFKKEKILPKLLRLYRTILS